MKNKYIPVRKLPDDFNNEIKTKREKAMSYLKESIRAGERMSSVLNGGGNARKQTP